MAKKRSDRNHVVYMVTNKETQERYIGITGVRQGRQFRKALKIRWDGHIYKAMVEKKQWTLSDNIRTFGIQAFDKQIMEIVRGKAKAHKREVELINQLQPELNTKKQVA